MKNVMLCTCTAQEKPARKSRDNPYFKGQNAFRDRN
jgi:hypothetical protein